MKIGKFAVLFAISILMISSLAMVNAYPVPSIPKPNAPEFTVKIVSHPYDVPPTSTTTTTIDQYTGKEKIDTHSTPGYHVENKSIEVTIKNRHFTPVTLSSYTSCGFDFDHIDYAVESESITVDQTYFWVSAKGHYGTENDWTGVGWVAQSGSESTIVNVDLDKYPSDALLDFRVSSGNGYVCNFTIKWVIPGAEFFGQKSDWSNIHALNLTDNVETVLPNTSAPVIDPQPPDSPPNPDPHPTTQTQTIAEPTQNPSTQNLTSTPTQQIEQTGSLSTFDWEKIDLALVGIIIIFCLATLILYKRRAGNNKPLVMG